MKIDAEIVCRKTPYGEVCEWKGGKVAKFWGEWLRDDQVLKVGSVHKFGGLKLRVIQYPLITSVGMPYDEVGVMLESPHAQLYQLYREWAEWFCRVVMRFELAIRAFMLKPVREGDLVPFTANIARRLL